MYHCDQLTESDFETTTAAGSAEVEMGVSAEQVFAALEDGPSWIRWVPVIVDVKWTSDKPFTVGTTRTVYLSGRIQVDEVFWAWEAPKRVGFYVEKTNSRLLRGLAECYDVTPIDADRCTVRWRMAIKLNRPLTFLERYMRLSLGTALERLLSGLEREARKFPKAPQKPASSATAN